MNIKSPKYFLFWLELASSAELEQGAHLVQQEKATLSCFPFHFIEETFDRFRQNRKKMEDYKILLLHIQKSLTFQSSEVMRRLIKTKEATWEMKKTGAVFQLRELI